MAQTARKYHTKQTHYSGRKVPGGGAAGNQTVQLGRVPNGANIVNIYTVVRTVFAGGVPTISFGTSGSPAAFFAAAGGPITTLGRNVVALIATGALSLTADQDIVGVIGGAPTSGDADLLVEFMVVEDLDIGAF
jgi:hypothetical protein